VSSRTREEWLESAASLVSAIFPEQTKLPPLKLSVGWPKGSRKAIGQCWHPQHSKDAETVAVFVSPVVEEPLQVLVTLAHELCHAVTGVSGHGKAFQHMAGRIGLLPPWTATPASEGLLEVLRPMLDVLGPYPHVQLSMAQRKKQATRYKLWQCACGVKVRRAGTLNATCNDCGKPFMKESA